MPSHQVRINKQYNDLCVKCLRRKNNDWDDEDRFPELCNVCKWIKYLERGVIKLPLPESVVRQMTNEEKAKLNV